ncbi:hypothetical protein FH972_021581 [Carpinus fangiana]|uniref:Glycolipid transfer protein domain-containing protein n=1 Tax=Carpinus fangiana TaxID=176857 RepID=A0A5N6KQE4_9ROSI|nr:hypothetical protein FH972_021581 [Carpinus fangiana]
MSKPTFPPGGTFFDTVKKSYADVSVGPDNAIPTSQFLEASESLLTLFDVLGSVAFNPVKGDMAGNIKKVRDREVAAPTESASLQELVVNEIKGKKHTAAEAQALRHNLTNPDKELSVSFREAYGGTLKPHHSFMIKPIFSAAMSATPYRKDFFAKLGDDQSKVDAEMQKWLEALEEQVKILKDFQATKPAKW